MSRVAGCTVAVPMPSRNANNNMDVLSINLAYPAKSWEDRARSGGRIRPQAKTRDHRSRTNVSGAMWAQTLLLVLG
jgi:hypothetical protein